jgi:nicotinate-nucleotide adenylyltransferase
MRRGGASYTSDTLAELKRAHPQDELSLILGWDAARLFATWHEPEKVKELASFVVVSRPGLPAPGVDELTAAGLDPERVMLCLRPTPDISGSALRRAIARGESISEKVPEGVARYIAEHHLYMDNR